MHITLVKPSWEYPISAADSTYNRVWPPLELLNCAAILRGDGHDVDVIDAHAERLPPERVGERTRGADLVVLTTSALDRWQCPPLQLAPVVATAEAIRPVVGKLALTGFHGTYAPERMLAMTGADLVIRGEPEMTVRELAVGTSPEDILGLSGQDFSTSDRPLLDLTELPMPAFDLIDPRRYDYEILGRQFALLEGSRGCRFDCAFCSKRTMMGTGMRVKSPDQLAEEVDEVVRLGFRSAYFIDLEWTANRELVESISRHILDRRHKLRWCCQTRADLVDPPLLKLMRQAGCRLIHFGVETGSPRIAKEMRKAIKVERQVEAVAAARRAGMETLCFFLFGFPGETDEEMDATVALARRIGPTYASFHRITPYPGSGLFDEYLHAGKSADDESIIIPEFHGDEERQADIDRRVRQAIKGYYLRPGYICKRLISASPAMLWRQFRLFLGYMRR